MIKKEKRAISGRFIHAIFGRFIPTNVGRRSNMPYLVGLFLPMVPNHNHVSVLLQSVNKMMNISDNKVMFID